MSLTTNIVVKFIKSNPGGDLHDRRCSNIFAKIPSQIISILFNKLLLHLSLGNLVQIVVDYRVRYSGLTVYTNSKYLTNLFVCLGHFLNFLFYFSPTLRYQVGWGEGWDEGQTFFCGVVTFLLVVFIFLLPSFSLCFFIFIYLYVFGCLHSLILSLPPLLLQLVFLLRVIFIYVN